MDALSNKYLTTLVQCKARQLVGKAGYTRQDLGDIEQDLWADFFEHVPQFNPRRASMNTFAAHVIETKMRKLLRTRRAKFRPSPIERHETLGQDEEDRGAVDRAHLAFDVDTVVRGLPSKLRQVATLLKTQSVSAVARRLGIPRRTLRSRYLRELRQIFLAHGLEDYLR